MERISVKVIHGLDIEEGAFRLMYDVAREIENEKGVALQVEPVMDLLMDGEPQLEVGNQKIPFTYDKKGLKTLILNLLSVGSLYVGSKSESIGIFGGRDKRPFSDSLTIAC